VDTPYPGGILKLSIFGPTNPEIGDHGKVELNEPLLF